MKSIIKLDDLVGVSLLVVSDKYPPNSVGGAEQSLHISLKEVAKVIDLVVVTFVDAFVPRRFELDGVRVIELPREPFQNFSLHTSGAVLRRLLGLSVFPGVTAPPRKEAHERYDALRGKESKDHLQGRRSVIIDTLSGLVDYLRPKKIHADNYRAILYVAEASPRNPAVKTCLIRDNRFHCARDVQNLLIGTKECTSCAFECADVDVTHGHRDLQKELLNKSLEYRKSALSKFDAVYVTSNYLLESVGRIIGNRKLDVIPNAGDSVVYVDTVVRGVGEFVGTHCLFVGMLNENKGQLQFLRACYREIKAEGLVIHFAGAGERIEKQIREFAAKHEISNNLVFHGYLSRGDIYKLYRKCQIVLAPTLWPEPFGRVPLEAGLTRRPCVSFAVGGLKESILHEVTGFLVERGDYRSFMQYVLKLAASAELRYQIGQAAYKHISKHFSLEKNVTLFVNSLRNAEKVRPYEERIADLNFNSRAA